jgi:5'-AMP-activated protein kinase regulatory gamma subunit
MSKTEGQQQTTVRPARRRTLSTGTQNNTSDDCLSYSEFEPDNFVLWRDSHIGYKLFRLPRTNEEITGKVDNMNICLCYLKSWTCYDVLPISSKLVVFDTRLSLKQSFFALVYNAIRAVPLWDTEFQHFVGMLTVTDYVKLLLHYHKMQPFDMTVIEEGSISTWKDRQQLVFVGPETSLQDAMNTICSHKVHWLPIVDPCSGNILHILTYSHLLRHLYYIFKRNDLHHPPFFSKRLEDLKVGTYDNLAVIYPDTPLHVALDLLVSRRLSAVPVVNKSSVLVSMFAKSDVLELAAHKSHNDLTVSVISVVKKLHSKLKPAMCHKSDSFYHAIEQIVSAKVQRLIVVSSGRKVVGVVSVSDIVQCLVQQANTS